MTKTMIKKSLRSYISLRLQLFDNRQKFLDFFIFPGHNITP